MTPGRAPRVACALLALATSALAAQGKGEQAGFVVRLGRDTIAVEQHVRTDRRLEGELVLRAPSVRRIHYLAALDRSGHVTRLDATMRALDGSIGPVTTAVVLDRDSADVTVKHADSSEHRRLAAPAGTVPVIGLSPTLIEQATRQARKAGADSVAFAWLPLPGPGLQPSFVVRRGKDSVDVGYSGSPMHARVDKRGRLLGLDGGETTGKVMVTRVAEVNVGAMANRFLQAEVSGGPMGGPMGGP